MTPFQPDAELLALINAACSDTITAEQVDLLQETLRTNKEACRLYLRYFTLESELRFLSTLGDADRLAQQRVGDRLATTADSSETPDPFWQTPETIGAAPPIALVIAPLGGRRQERLANQIPSDWPIAYLASAVICGLGILICAFIPVYHHVQFARQSNPPSSAPAAGHSRPARSSSEFPPMVGQVTGMVDCKWSNPQTEASNGASVPLGRKYALASGLMQITYDTGAKVILQGPCTYEVESKSSGYLSVGKLTARVEKGPRSKVQGSISAVSRPQPLAPSPSSNPSLSTLHSPLFTIKTPTATVTDLGTEFGVEVDTQGGTVSHVFRGLVEVQLVAYEGQTGQTVRLAENESIRVKKAGSGDVLSMQKDTVDPAVFVRAEQLPKLAEELRLKPLRRWQAYSQQLRKDPALVAYYTFERHTGDTSTLPNMSAAGSALDGRVDSGEWVGGRLPGKLALYFRGAGSGDMVVLPEQKQFEFPGAFSIAVWFRHQEYRANLPMLIAKGADSWRLIYDKRGPLRLGTKGYAGILWQSADGETRVDDARWHLGVGVYEPVGDVARLRVYVDGHLDAENEASVPRVRNDKAVWFGSVDHATGNQENTFTGWIDEVAIFSRVLSAKEVKVMFEAGDPAQQPQTSTK